MLMKASHNKEVQQWGKVAGRGVGKRCQIMYEGAGRGGGGAGLAYASPFAVASQTGRHNQAAGLVNSLGSARCLAGWLSRV